MGTSGEDAAEECIAGAMECQMQPQMTQMDADGLSIYAQGS